MLVTPGRAMSCFSRFNHQNVRLNKYGTELLGGLCRSAAGSGRRRREPEKARDRRHVIVIDLFRFVSLHRRDDDLI